MANALFYIYFRLVFVFVEFTTDMVGWWLFDNLQCNKHRMIVDSLLDRMVLFVQYSLGMV